MILFRNRRSVRPGARVSMAELRVQKDIAELAEQRTTSQSCSVHISPLQRDFPLVRVYVNLAVKTDVPHLYAGALFQAVILFGEKYPFVPPTVTVMNRVYHPNVDIDTGVMLMNLLSADNWKPVITLSSIILAMELTLLQPDFSLLPPNPVNREMATAYKFGEFEARVRVSLSGGRVSQYEFEENYGQLVTLKRKRPAEGWERRTMVKVLDSEPMHLDVYRIT